MHFLDFLSTTLLAVVVVVPFFLKIIFVSQFDSSSSPSGADNYIAADWHHDRAGRRLKLFVFLHDIAEVKK